LKWPFGKNSPQPTPQVREVVANGQSITARIDKSITSRTALKRANGRRVNSGMIVVYSDDVFPNRAGILLDIDADDVCRVMLMQDDGTNLLEVRCYANRLRQARLEEIPPSRRPVSAEVAQALGYY
jgi:hypothetical protein